MTDDSPTTTSSLADGTRQRERHDTLKRGSADGLHTCATCSIAFSTATNLERHARERHDGRSHVCELCAATFPRRHLLEAHLRKHATDGERFRCTVCATTAPTRADLARHVRSHRRQEGGTACPVCGVVFRWYWQMRRHRALHATARHSCAVCDRLFQHRSRLVQHLKKHVAEDSDVSARKTAQCALDEIAQKRKRRPRIRPVKTNVKGALNDAVQISREGSHAVQNKVCDDNTSVGKSSVVCTQVLPIPVSVTTSVQLPKMKKTFSVPEVTSSQKGVIRPILSMPLELVFPKNTPRYISRSADGATVVLNNVTTIIPKNSSFTESVPELPPKIRNNKRRCERKTYKPKRKHGEVIEHVGFTVESESVKEASVAGMETISVASLDALGSSGIEDPVAHVDTTSSDQVENLMALQPDNLDLNVDRVAGFGEAAPRRPMTLEEAVRQITGDDSPEDPSSLMEFSAEDAVVSGTLNHKSHERHFSPFEPSSSPVRDLNTDLTRHELGFELEVASLHDHEDQFGTTSSQPFEDLSLETNSAVLDSNPASEALPFEMALGAHLSDGPTGSIMESDSNNNANVEDSHDSQDVELEVDAGDLEGNLGDDLVRLLESGVRVEVEQGQDATETVMVITLVDE